MFDRIGRVTSRISTIFMARLARVRPLDDGAAGEARVLRREFPHASLRRAAPRTTNRGDPMTPLIRAAVAATALACAWTGAAAQIVVSANDNKATLDNGANKVVVNPPPDTVA